MWQPDQILGILDRCAEDCYFPDMGNGYLYPAASRLSAYSDGENWALVVEIFGYSPREGLPNIHTSTFSSRIRRTKTPENFLGQDAFEDYVALHPYDESDFFHPLARGDWLTEGDCDFVNTSAPTIPLRDQPVPLPPTAAIDLASPPRLWIYELCRLLAIDHREQVLCTEKERRLHVPEGLPEILVLDEWRHPDIVEEELPSHSEAFRQLADVLCTGDPTAYQPTQPPNTHWTNWPDAGQL